MILDNIQYLMDFMVYGFTTKQNGTSHDCIFKQALIKAMDFQF